MNKNQLKMMKHLLKKYQYCQKFIELILSANDFFHRIAEFFSQAKDPLLPNEQAGFRPENSIVNQFVLLTQNIEHSFEAKIKAAVVLSI